MASKEKLTLFRVQQNDDKATALAFGHYTNAFGEDAGYGVWKQRTNYSHGRYVKTWRVVKMGMTEADAMALFKKKTST